MFTGKPKFGRRKYSNKKTMVDGHLFDSKKEAVRYGLLKMRESLGEITHLELQPEFRCVVNGVLVCKYRADFAYFEEGRGRIIEDVKSAITRKNRAYRIKKKLVEALYPGVTIVEVMT